MTHEQFIHAVRDAALLPLDEATAARLRNLKLTYGAGARGQRGVCFFKAWENGTRKEFIEISAAGEESTVQLAGTTLHELAHSLAGWEAGHGRAWKHAAHVLGLKRGLAVGQNYGEADFDSALWGQIVGLTVQDGRPCFGLPLEPARCPVGIGTRGGRSRGKGSGSRLRLFVCDCKPAVKVRVARDTFPALCLNCNSAFKRAFEDAIDINSHAPGEVMDAETSALSENSIQCNYHADWRLQ